MVKKPRYGICMLQIYHYAFNLIDFDVMNMDHHDVILGQKWLHACDPQINF